MQVRQNNGVVAKPLKNLNSDSAFRGEDSAFRGQNSAFHVVKRGVLCKFAGTKFLIRRCEMRNEIQNAEVVFQKRGIPVYASNPSVPSKDQIAKPRRARLGDDRKGLVIDGGTGEVVGCGGAIMYEWEEVDKERFVKLFLAGLKQAAGLSKAGLAVFELVYNALRATPGTDKVELSVHACGGMSKTTFYDGLRELLTKEFLYRSVADGVFFVNIRYMFNGDRLAFVKGYHLKGSQPELPLPPPAAPTA